MLTVIVVQWHNSHHAGIITAMYGDAYTLGKISCQGEGHLRNQLPFETLFLKECLSMKNKYIYAVSIKNGIGHGCFRQLYHQQFYLNRVSYACSTKHVREKLLKKIIEIGSAVVRAILNALQTNTRKTKVLNL